MTLKYQHNEQTGSSRIAIIFFKCSKDLSTQRLLNKGKEGEKHSFSVQVIDDFFNKDLPRVRKLVKHYPRLKVREKSKTILCRYEKFNLTKITTVSDCR